MASRRTRSQVTAPSPTHHIADAAARPPDLTDVGRELALLARRMEQVRRDLVVDGVTLDRSAYLLLDRIDLFDSPTAGRIADFLQLDHSTVTRQLGALERDGLMIRQTDPEGGRAQILALTERGQRLLAGARSARSDRLAHTLSDWSDRERTSLSRLLRRLNKSLERRAAELGVQEGVVEVDGA